MVAMIPVVVRVPCGLENTISLFTQVVCATMVRLVNGNIQCMLSSLLLQKRV